MNRSAPVVVPARCRDRLRAGVAWRAALSALAALAALAALPAQSATPDRAAPAPLALTPVQAEARQSALVRASDATVGLEVKAVEDARSAATLGAQRSGSGVVIDAGGLVVTIGYLVLEAEQVEIVLDGGKRVPARVVAYDLASGFGLVQALAPLAVEPVPLGRSDAVVENAPLMVVSGGDEGAISVAKMVSRRPFAGYWEYHIDGALFTVPARPDHSGAGLFDADGALVGIGSLLVSDALGGSGSGPRGNMFVPVELLKPLLPELLARGASARSARPWLGVNCVEYAGQVRVLRLQPESPAEAAGLQPGDVVAGVDGTPVADLRSFYEAIWRAGPPDRVVHLDVRRGPTQLAIDVRAVDRMRTLRTPRGI